MDRSIFARRSRATLWSCMRRCAVRGVWCVVILAACATPPTGDPQGEIAALLARSASDWNRGDLAGFMGDYAHDSLTSYVSAGHVMYGWQKLFDRYQTTYFGAGKSRDSLAFEEAHMRPPAPDLALCTARLRSLRRDSVPDGAPLPPIPSKPGAPRA